MDFIAVNNVQFVCCCFYVRQFLLNFLVIMRKSVFLLFPNSTKFCKFSKINKRDYSATSRFIKTASGCTIVQFKYRCATKIKINDTINPILSLITVHSF